MLASVVKYINQSFLKVSFLFSISFMEMARFYLYYSVILSIFCLMSDERYLEIDSIDRFSNVLRGRDEADVVIVPLLLEE